MRHIKYTRTEFHADDETVENDLLCFVYDVPYLEACGILPPFHVLNTIFASGGDQGGMGPGAEWSPFIITEAEYAELTKAITNTPIESIRNKVRYGEVQLEIDPAFDDLRDQLQWIEAACKKHKEAYYRKIGRT